MGYRPGQFLIKTARLDFVVADFFLHIYNPTIYFFLTKLALVSFAAVIWVVTQRFSPTNGCLNPNPICFPLFRVHVKITECTNHALPIVSAETNHVTVVCQ